MAWGLRGTRSLYLLEAIASRLEAIASNSRLEAIAIRLEARGIHITNYSKMIVKQAEAIEVRGIPLGTVAIIRITFRASHASRTRIAL